MLVVTRKKDQRLIIGHDIEVRVLRIGRDNVRLGIRAPAEVTICRSEIFEAVQRPEASSSEEAEQSVHADAKRTIP